MINELCPQYDRHKSFCHKAILVREGNRETLYSYETPVVVYHFDTKKVELLEDYDYSRTTMRHVKEYLKQLGFDPKKYM